MRGLMVRRGPLMMGMVRRDPLVRQRVFRRRRIAGKLPWFLGWITAPPVMGEMDLPVVREGLSLFARGFAAAAQRKS